jgi:trimeric autotransporter adhesin
MRWMPTGKRLVEIVFAGLLLAGMVALPRTVLPAQSTGGSTTVSTTQLTDTVFRADGTTATGTVEISWPAFTTANGLSVPAGNTSVTIGTSGVLSVALVPNSGSSPMGSYYTAVYQLDDGTVSREYWVVPVSQFPVTVSSIKSTVLPASVALQTVTKSYVDTAIVAAVTGHPLLTASPFVLITGDTMTGPLVLPGDPVSANQAADKNYVDENVTAVAAGAGQKVALHPSANQVIAQPTGTDLSVNLLNGVVYASQYATGPGNNGIANAMASPDCTTGCEVKVDESYTGTDLGRPATFPNQAHLEDTRRGSRQDSYLNPENLERPGSEIGQQIDVTSTRSGAAVFQATGAQDPASYGLKVTQEGLTGGSNLFPQSVEGTVPYFKSVYSALAVTGVYNTQGQHGLAPLSTTCYGVGDCLLGSEFITSSGGYRDEADEGAHPMDIQIAEDSLVFDGTCSSGCSTGSTQISVAVTSGTGTEGDGRFLIDTNPAKALKTGSLIGGTIGDPYATATFSGTSFPVSTFFATNAIIPSQANNLAPGTVTIAIATSGIPAGYATNTAAAPSPTGVACVVDQVNGFNSSNYEMANYTVVDGTHLQMTLNKVHAALATVAMGGLCGYGLEQTVDTSAGIRQVFPVVGSISATEVYYAGSQSAVVGQSGQTSGFLNMSVAIASLARSGNQVTLTTASNLPADVNGLSLTVAGVADSSYNGTFQVTTTGSQTLTYSQTGANSTSSGGTVSLLTGQFVLYPMAEVLSVLDAATKTVDGTMTLAPNLIPFASGDTLEEPHFFQQSVHLDTTFVSQVMPRPTTATQAGITYEGNNGPGVQGWLITNATPATNYFGNGGTHGPPDFAYSAAGEWKRMMIAQAGDQSVFTINCNSHGCGRWDSVYNLFELQSNVSTDTVQWNPVTSALNFNLRGAGYSFTPQSFTAGTVNATTVTAGTISGAISGASITSGTVAAARLPVFGPSGVNHAPGVVPDPGSTAGSTRYLREDGTWMTPAGSGGATGSASITSGTIAGVTIDGSVIGGTTPAAGTFTTLKVQTAIAATSGGTGSLTAPAAGQVLVGSTGGGGYTPETVGGDCTVQANGTILCTKTNGVALGSAATTASTAYDAAGAAAAIVPSGNGLAGVASGAFQLATAHVASLPVECIAASGSAAAYTCSTSPTFTPVAGDKVRFRANVANAGPATLSVNGAAAAGIRKQGGSATLIANDLIAGLWIGATFDGTFWQLDGQLGNGTSAVLVQHYPVRFEAFGDSYNYGFGATQIGNAFAQLVANDTPAREFQFSVGGTTTPTIANATLANFIPDPSLPAVVLMNGGNNDYTQDTCSHAASSNCITNYKNTLAAEIGYPAFPPQDRIFASNGTVGSGCTVDSTTFVNPLNGNVAGTAESCTASGSGVTWAIPATNAGTIGLMTTNTNGAAGTYSVSIDGTLRTDDCSGTTTFSIGGCGGTAMVSSPAPQSQLFAVTAGVSHTVIVVPLSANPVKLIAVEWVPSTLPSDASAVFVANSGAAFDISGIYSVASAAVVSQFASAGLQVYPVDIRDALLALPGGGISSTATATCAGSTFTNHPSDCGQYAEYKAFLAEEATAGYQFSSPGIGGKYTAGDGNLYKPPTIFQAPSTAVTFPGTFTNFNGGVNVAAGTDAGWTDFNNNTADASGWRFGSGTVLGASSTFKHSVFGSKGLVDYFCGEALTSYGNPGADASYTVGWCLNDSTGLSYTAGDISQSNGAATFTVASGCGTTGAVAGGPTAGTFTAGQTACAPVINLPTAPHGWACFARDLTTPADTLSATGTTTTSASFSGTVVSGDTIQITCPQGY